MTIERLTGVLILCGLIAFICGFHPLPTLFLIGWFIGDLIVVWLRKGGYHEPDAEEVAENEGMPPVELGKLPFCKTTNEAADFRQRE